MLSTDGYTSIQPFDAPLSACLFERDWCTWDLSPGFRLHLEAHKRPKQQHMQRQHHGREAEAQESRTPCKITAQTRASGQRAHQNSIIQRPKRVAIASLPVSTVRMTMSYSTSPALPCHL
jgi:hypothetical protein